MSNIICRPFRFTEHVSYVAPSVDESKWTPLRPTITPPQVAPPPLTKKFIYVFQRLGSSFLLYAEVFADAGGQLSVVPGQDARVTARDVRPPPSPLNTDIFTVPHTVNGKRAFYTFFVSRIRLPSDSIIAIETDSIDGLVHDLDLAPDAAFIAGPGASPNVTNWFLPVTDPVTVALNLHEDYERACDDVVHYTMEFKGQRPAERLEVVNRHKKVLLAKLLKSVFDGDPSDKLGLENEVEFGRVDVAHFITDYENQVTFRINQRDAAAETLCFFLGGSPVDIVEQSYRFVESQEYQQWIEIFSTCMERLGESPIGKARIGQLVGHPSFLIKEYILRSDVAPDVQFAVGRKCNTAIVNLWRELAPAMIIKHEPEFAKRLVDSLGNISREHLFDLKTVPNNYSYKKPNGRVRDVKDTAQLIVVTDDIGGTLSKWAKDGKPGQTLEVLAMGVEVANLLLALEVLANADPGERALAGLSALGSVLDAVSAFNCVLRIGERAIKAVGALSAAIDAFFAARDGLRAYEANDRSSAIGFGAVAFGSVLTMIGCTCAILGVGAASTGVGLPLGLLLEVVGGVIIAAGWLVAVLTADSDIEQFVSHCDFGVNFPSKSQAKPKWATREFAAWSDLADGLDRQISSLMLLLASFKMHAAEKNQLVVTLGLLTESSKLRLRFKTQYAQARRDLTLTIDLSTKTVTHQGDPQDLSKVIVSDRGPQTVVTVTVVPPPNELPPIQLMKCDCEVLLILDDKLTVPQNSSPFNYFVGAVQTATQPGPVGPDHSSYD